MTTISRHETKEEAEQFEREFEFVMAMVRKWGWATALPDGGDDVPVKGFVVGTPDYLDEVLLHLEPGEHWRSDEEDNGYDH